ncbi:unnamed protein product [Spirodela intermedia]|uniref:Plastid lipid-associated protein/fibrillin conserved domain-containing protein n=1 Tax=Spirodela intermedia TaxID=51605 RepID=A0A7I8JLV0_SPIIN|nr:unnamed protein product [Spirodela intermedia]CAA6671147.1 unnamed protein product [Spirodela intermedia]
MLLLLLSRLPWRLSSLRLSSPPPPGAMVPGPWFLGAFLQQVQDRPPISRPRGLRRCVRRSAGSGAPEDLVESVLSKVKGTDRGVLLSKEGHAQVDKLTAELSKCCVEEPVKCPLIFGEWDVVYCSNPTSPGGGYRSTIGRLIFKTNEMIQVVEAPDSVKNRVSFSVFGFLNGKVSLNGKLKVLSDKWIQVIFEPPELKIGAFDFRYGGESEVKLEITYVDEKIRLGKGSRGSLFVFRRLG